MPKTAQKPGLSVKPLKTPKGTYTEEDIINTDELEQRRFAKDYFIALLKRFDGNRVKALAAYNAGVGKVGKVVAKDSYEKGRIALPKETRNHLYKAYTIGMLTEEEIVEAFPMMGNVFGFKNIKVEDIPRKPKR